MWVAIEDGFIRHNKIVQLTDGEFRTWMRVLCWSAQYRTEGAIPATIGNELVGATPKSLKKFLEIGLFDSHPGGYMVHDWKEYNGSARERQLARERKREERKRQKDKECHDDERDIVTPESQECHDDSHGNVTDSLAGARTSPAHPKPHTPVPKELQIQKQRPLKKLDAIDRLYDMLDDARPGTKQSLYSLHLRYGLSDGDYEYAKEEILKPSTRSRSALALTILEERGKAKESAA